MRRTGEWDDSEQGARSERHSDMYTLHDEGLIVSPTGSLVLPVARDRDLRLILQTFGILEQFELGEIKCTHCDCKLSWENLGAVVTSEDKLKLYCDLSDCIEQASERQSN